MRQLTRPTPMRRRSWLASGLIAFVLCVAPLATSAQDAKPEPLPEQGTALSPGRYVSTAVGPSIGFRVDEGWVVGSSPEGPIFTLERADQPGTVVTVTRFDGEVFLDSCDSTSMSRVDASVARLGEIVSGNPFLNPGPPKITQVGGDPALQLDVAVPAYTECPLPFILLWALPIAEGGEFVQVPDQQSRFIFIDVAGDVVVVAIESFPGVPFGGVLEESMTLVESMRIEPGEYIPPQPSPEATEIPEASPGS